MSTGREEINLHTERQYPDHGKKLKSELIKVHFESGEEYRLEGLFTDALDHYSQVIALDGNHAEALAHRGGIYRALKQYDKAEQDLKKAIELDSNNAFAFSSLCEVYRLNGQYEKLKQYSRKAIELNPNYRFLWESAERGRQALQEKQNIADQIWRQDTTDRSVLRNPKRLAVIHTLTGHVWDVNTVAVSADGKRLVSGSDDMTIMIWDLETGKSLKTLQEHTNRVRSVAVSADGKRLVSGSDDMTIMIWDLETGKSLKTLQGHGHKYNIGEICTLF